MNVNPTNPDTLALPLKTYDVVKGCAGLGAELMLRQPNALMSLMNSHNSDPSSTATLDMLSSNFLQVFVSPALASGWKSS